MAVLLTLFGVVLALLALLVAGLLRSHAEILLGDATYHWELLAQRIGI